MPWPFVVIGEATSVISNRDGCLFEIAGRVGTALRCRPFFGAHGVMRPTRTKDRIKRILRKHVLNIGDEQFLMLLLMMPSKDQNRFDFIEQFPISIRKQ